MNLEKSKQLIIWDGKSRRISKWSLMSRNIEYSINDRSNYDRNWPKTKKAMLAMVFRFFTKALCDQVPLFSVSICFKISTFHEYFNQTCGLQK